MKKLKLSCSLILLIAVSSCSKTNDVKNKSVAKSLTDSNLATVQATKTKVVFGYIPSWENVQTVMANTDLSILTHINIAFFSPNSAGQMISGGEPVCSDASSSDINYIVTQAHQKGVKVLASLQGGTIPTCSGDLATILSSSSKMATLVSNLKSFTTYYNLDGIDVDIESSSLSSINGAGNYTPFIKSLRAALNPIGKLVTAASDGYTSAMIPKTSFQYLDYVLVMSYDNNWGTSGNHSTYADALTHISNFLNAGCPSSKVVLGMPFYGYKGDVGTGTLTAYNTIVNLYPAAAYVDSYAGYQYNGINTIEEKTTYAAQHIGGVMVWELSEDATGQYSLLKAIGTKINQ
jgi:chitinase